MIDFGLTVDPASFDRALLHGARRMIDQLFRDRKATIALKAGEVAADAVRNAPEAASLLTGPLRHELGVVSPDRAVEMVAAAVGASVVVDAPRAKVAGRSLVASLVVRVLREDLGDVVPAMNALRFYSRGGEVDWLRWLLASGTTIAVAGFRYVPVVSGRSRTGLGLMATGGNWSVPRGEAGVPGDNWLSRALDRAGPDVAAAAAREAFRA